MASRHDSESGALLDEEQGNTELVYTAPSRRHVWMLALGAVGVLLGTRCSPTADRVRSSCILIGVSCARVPCAGHQWPRC